MSRCQHLRVKGDGRRRVPGGAGRRRACAAGVPSWRRWPWSSSPLSRGSRSCRTAAPARTGPRRPPVRAAAAPPVLDAAESGLLPWHLAAPLSREVVVPGSPGRLIVLGGLTPAGTSASGVYALRTATGTARRDRRAQRPAARCRRGDLRRAGAGLRGRIAGHRGHGPGVLRRWHRPRDGIAARAALRRRGGHHRRHRLRRGRLRREQARRLGAGHRRTAGPSPRWQRCRFRCAIRPSPPWTA